jgi:hypothetical protein
MNYSKYSKTLWTVLKKIYKFIIPDPIEGCNGSCEQGKVPCDCGKYGSQYDRSITIGDCIIQLHTLANSIEDSEEGYKVRLLADELAKIGNRLQEKNSVS